MNENIGREVNGVSRRHFLETAAAAAAFGISGTSAAAGEDRGVSLVVNPTDPVAGSAPGEWAAKELEQCLAACGITVRRCERLAEARAGDLCIVAADANSGVARQLAAAAHATVPAEPEALGLIPAGPTGSSVLLACGHDERGLVYALLELADRARWSTEPLVSLNIRAPIIERPANPIRSLARLFVSEPLDMPWYNDREMWPAYLTMLATQRFNRFQLALGIGYDHLVNVTDSYFLFPYPFLLPVPGYDVRVRELPDDKRQRNLETLRFISEQTAARGLHFQLGVWMHGYDWSNSPKAKYTISGLSRENHAPYCRDALHALLDACPAISGITFRIHGEAGVPEGDYEFWKTVFQGVAKCGRKVEIDMHAKGMDKPMMDVALGTGMPITISPKYWAEHLGMPYHQAEIRELERQAGGEPAGTKLMKLSTGPRHFTRYGYGDLLTEGRPYRVMHRIWPGTQRLLLWGDPQWSAAYSRAFGFCGSTGAELMEPLSFRGRRGSGARGDRCGYADASLRPKWDWEKFAYSLRVWGRLLYNPDATADVWGRYLHGQFGGADEAVELALAAASRILPIVTTAHGTSAGNNTYWPEMYTNQPIVNPGSKLPFTDTPSPRVFGNVSPLDPQLFLRINDFAEELTAGRRSGKYSPIEVARWIEDYAEKAAKHLAEAERKAADANRPEFRRMAIDVDLQIGLGQFFAAKLRTGVLYAIFQRTGCGLALDEAVRTYRLARAAWVRLADHAKGVYQQDVAVGEREHLRGHWLDRLAAIDQDIADMVSLRVQGGSNQPDHVWRQVQEVLGRPQRGRRLFRHAPPEGFTAGHAITLKLVCDGSPSAARLHYRHVNQAERYQTLEMQSKANTFHATIPAAYTNSPYPLQYYFELIQGPTTAWLCPGFDATLANQPYFVVRQSQNQKIAACTS